jgi:hypothetical protein
MIFIQALLFKLKLEKRASWRNAEMPAWSLDFSVNEVICNMDCFNIYTATKVSKGEANLLLVDRVSSHADSFWSYDFIVLDWVGGGPSSILGDWPEQTKFRARSGVSGRVRLTVYSNRYYYWRSLDQLFTRDNKHLIFVAIK